MFRQAIQDDATAGLIRQGCAAPWDVDPHRLWSLLDMRVHLAGNWLAVINNLERLKWHMSVVGDHPSDDEHWQAFADNRKRCMGWMREEIASLPFSDALHLHATRVLDDVEVVDPRVDFEPLRVSTRLEDLVQNIQSELKAQLFLVVPAERKKWFKDGDAPLFGQQVADAFPESSIELAEAGRCFALARWTACVFHVMRGLELALHKWAAQLGASQFKAIELENWKNILDAAQRKIDQLQQQPKSPEKDATLAYYSETRAHFLSIKDAWRNHVAHARERYDEQRALAILNHAGEFFRLLASSPL